MITYKTTYDVWRTDISLEQYEADMKEAFMDGLDTAPSLAMGGVKATPDAAFDKFYAHHSHRRKI